MKTPENIFNELLLKGTVGFDKFFKEINDMTHNLSKISTYPPYNIRKVDENVYVIEVAVAGFGKQNIELTLENSVLTIRGNIESNENDLYLFKGIAERPFTRTFTLADSVEIKNAEMINGMLKVWLEKMVPETKKRNIPIN